MIVDDNKCGYNWLNSKSIQIKVMFCKVVSGNAVYGAVWLCCMRQGKVRNINIRCGFYLIKIQKSSIKVLSGSGDVMDG